MYSSNVLSTLYAAGWTPDRKVSTAQWVDQLEFEGFVMLPSAIDILERFGGLETRPRKSSSDVFLPGVLRFDPVLAASGDFDRVAYWQNRLSLKFSPIAETGRGDILLIADDDRIFTCTDNRLYFDGDSFDDALEYSLIGAKRKSVEIGCMSDSSQDRVG